MRDLLTSVLDALSLLLIAAGAGAFTYQWIGLACLAVSGVVILSGSLLASWLSEAQEIES